MSRLHHSAALSGRRFLLPQKEPLNMIRAARKRHTKDLTCIYRLCDPKRGGWYVHVFVQRNGKVFMKEFFERRCGGEATTMQLAQAWRDRVIDEHPAMSLADFCSIVRSNNTSGVPGVMRHDKRQQSGQQSGQDGAAGRVYWVARIPYADGQSRSLSFSVATLGEEEAKRRAVEARLQGLRDLDGQVFRPDMQPQQVSGPDDIAALDAALRAPAERRARKAAEREQISAGFKARLQRAAERRTRMLADDAVALRRVRTNSGEPYISRNAAAGGGSDYWRVSIERQGKKHRKTFTDSMYGGKDAALLAAKAWRDRVFIALPLDSRAQVVARVNATNTSGVAGVHSSSDSRGGAATRWVARAPKTKGQALRSKTFSIAKYGAGQAFALAVQARQAFVAELDDAQCMLHPAPRQLMKTLADGREDAEMDAQPA